MAGAAESGTVRGKCVLYFHLPLSPSVLTVYVWAVLDIHPIIAWVEHTSPVAVNQYTTFRLIHQWIILQIVGAVTTYLVILIQFQLSIGKSDQNGTTTTTTTTSPVTWGGVTLSTILPTTVPPQ